MHKMINQDMLEFKEKGFILANNSNTLKKLRNYGINFKKFDSSVFNCNGRNPRYTDNEVFGKRLFYYYDAKKEKDFVNFLVKKFFEKNPHPNRELRSAFTRILHRHQICWYGCYHGGKRITFLKEEDTHSFV